MLKRLVLFGLLLSTAIGASAQIKIEGLTRVTGQWLDHPNDSIHLVYNKVPFTNRPLTMSTVSDSNGRFELNFPFEHRWPLELRHGENSITFIISPEDSFNIHIKPDGMYYGYEISGRGTDEAKLNYLNFRDFDRDRNEGFGQIIQNTDPAQYENTISTWMKEYEKIIKKNTKAVQPNSIVKKRTQELAKIKEATYYLYYIKYKRDIRDTAFDTPKNWEAIINNPELRAWDYTASPEYQNFIFLYLTQMGPAPTGDVCTNFKNYADFADSVFMTNSKIELMPRIILEAVQNDCYQSVKEEYKAYEKYNDKPDYSMVLNQRIGSQISLQPGEPAPDFVFLDTDGNKHSLEDFRGKVIYLDFWATWCGPCIRAMKSSGPLKEHFKDNEDIEFVYISTDRDHNKWMNHYITNNGEPNHWHMGASAPAASQAYRITHIPRYVIIDKDGNLVDSNAPRPYDPALIPILEELTKQKYSGKKTN